MAVAGALFLAGPAWHSLPSKLNYSHGPESRCSNGTRIISYRFHRSSSLDRHYTKQMSFRPHFRVFHFSLYLWRTDLLTTYLTVQEIPRLPRNQKVYYLVHKKPPEAPVLCQYCTLSTILILSYNLHCSTLSTFFPSYFVIKSEASF
jgi:hypothetical protein